MRTIDFDWDGTIVDSIGALYETGAAICRRIGVPFDLTARRSSPRPEQVKTVASVVEWADLRNSRTELDPERLGILGNSAIDRATASPHAGGGQP